MCIPTASEIKEITRKADPSEAELDLTGLDDNELSSYIMTESEARYKDIMWNKLNADYLKEAKAREERLAKEKEEGKSDKKRRKVQRKKNLGPSHSAGEAIEKMLQEKKISNKINYDILKTLTAPKSVETITTKEEQDEKDSKFSLNKRMENSFLFGKMYEIEVFILFVLKLTFVFFFNLFSLEKLKFHHRKHYQIDHKRHRKEQKLFQWACRLLKKQKLNQQHRLL